MKLKHTLAIAALVLIPLVAACTPHQIQVFKSLNPEQQQAVLDHYSRQYEASQRSKDCYSAINKHWHGDKAWARKIVWRESRNNPSAQNPSSSAKGCAQLMHSIHAWRYTAVGCSPSQWANPDCNIKAAWNLRQAAGRSPWQL